MGFVLTVTFETDSISGGKHLMDPVECLYIEEQRSNQLLNINQEITIESSTSVCTCITLLLPVPQKYNICAQTRVRWYDSCVMVFKISKNRQPINSRSSYVIRQGVSWSYSLPIHLIFVGQNHVQVTYYHQCICISSP